MRACFPLCTMLACVRCAPAQAAPPTITPGAKVRVLEETTDAMGCRQSVCVARMAGVGMDARHAAKMAKGHRLCSQGEQSIAIAGPARESTQGQGGGPWTRRQEFKSSSARSMHLKKGQMGVVQRLDDARPGPILQLAPCVCVCVLYLLPSILAVRHRRDFASCGCWPRVQSSEAWVGLRAHSCPRMVPIDDVNLLFACTKAFELDRDVEMGGWFGAGCRQYCVWWCDCMESASTSATGFCG